MTSVYRITYAVGQCRTATDSRGVRWHAVPGTSEWDTSLCGYVPGRRSNGWSDYPGTEVTCPKCLARLAKEDR
jgi:hypothetical protein